VAQGDELAREVVRTGAGLHHGRAGVELGKELDELLAVELPTEHRQPLAVLSVQVKRVLAQVDADQRYRVHDDLRHKEEHPGNLCHRGVRGKHEMG